jgi:hypothetical protein
MASSILKVVGSGTPTPDTTPRAVVDTGDKLPTSLDNRDAVGIDARHDLRGEKPYSCQATASYSTAMVSLRLTTQSVKCSARPASGDS